MQKVKFGFIGAGAIAAHAARAVGAHGQGEIIAVSDLNEERRQQLAKEFGIRHSHADAAELLSNKDVDAVYIAVPNKFHAPLAIEALNAGKAVMLEKPFALNSEEAEAIAAAAKKSGKPFMLGMNQRFTADNQKLRALTEANFFGEIYHAKAYWQRRSGIPRMGTWFVSKATAGGGCLCDIGVHLLDLCLYLMDNFKPVSVSGQTYTKFGNRGLGEGGWGKSDASGIEFDVDDFASAFIRMANGATVNLQVSWACHDRESNRMGVQLFGTEAGALSSPLELYHSLPTKGGYQVSTTVESKIAYPHCERFHNFINHILTGEPLCVTIEQALVVQKILDAIAQSADTGREVLLG